jgi:hypothetical protein
MEYVRTGPYGVGFICKMRDGGCEGTVTVSYAGRVCGSINVVNPLKDYVGSVVGPDQLDAGETAIYYHDLGPGAKYTGNAPGTNFENELGNGRIVTMPANATQGAEYEVSFSGPCGAVASKTITMLPENCEWGPRIGYDLYDGGLYVYREIGFSAQAWALSNPRKSGSSSIEGFRPVGYMIIEFTDRDPWVLAVRREYDPGEPHWDTLSPVTRYDMTPVCP